MIRFVCHAGFVLGLALGVSGCMEQGASVADPQAAQGTNVAKPGGKVKAGGRTPADITQSLSKD